jgi:two-component system, LuxR family, response regulator FixJ
MSVTPGSVIVVDDDAAVRHSLKFALEQEGMVVKVYASGEELLAAGDLPEHGCLVIDHYMPHMTGVELVNRLRHRLVALPVILITTNATADLRRSAVRSGIRQVLEKPLEDGSLFDSIRGALAVSATSPSTSGTSLRESI